jgi:hypothetical protein
MSDQKRALVLHLHGGGEPLVFALSAAGAADLAPNLAGFMAAGDVHDQELADGNTVTINFRHVVTALVDELPPLARVYGSGQPQRHGFAT